MTHQESQYLFKTHLNLDNKEAEMYRKSLEKIAKWSGFHPQLLRSITSHLASENITPISFLQSLEETSNPIHVNRQKIIQSWEKLLDDLSDEQRHLFALMGVFGEGTWCSEMLASIAIRRFLDIQSDLRIFIKRGFVQKQECQRYQINSLVRALAKQMLYTLPLYMQKAAYVLLAHECLKYTHNTLHSLKNELNIPYSTKYVSLAYDHSFLHNYRDIVSIEHAHIREVIGAALRYQQRQLLLQFVDIALYTVNDYSGSHSFSLPETPLSLATLIEPTILSAYHHQQNSKAKNITNGISLNIEIGRVVDATFENICIRDNNWVGVNADEMIFHDIELKECTFNACTFSNNIWLNIETSDLTLTDSEFRHTLIENANLSKVDMKDADLSGAVLKHIKLQGANLRNCNLSSAFLDHVDLRGADLRGAKVDNAIFRQVLFQGCQAEGIDWKTAHIVVPTPNAQESDDILMFLGRQAQERIRGDMPTHPRIQAHSKLHTISTSKYHGSQELLKDLKFIGTDFRSFLHTRPSPDELPKRLIVSSCEYTNADFRTAQICNADFSESMFQHANFRHAKLELVSFRRASMRDADLRTAILTDVSFEEADLTNANLRYAAIQNSNLCGAILRSTQLSNASLTAAQLQKADLEESDLSAAFLEGAQLQGAQLKKANLHNACLRAANLSDANLQQANCDQVDFTGANITDQQLAQAASWSGAMLPHAEKVLTIQDQETLSQVISQKQNLRLAYLTGSFQNVKLSAYDLFGVQMTGDFTWGSFQQACLDYGRLSGTFVEIHFTNTFLQNAVLSGIFSNSTFDGAQVTHARLNGIFASCSFRACDLHNTSFDGVSFVDCDFSGAQLDEEFLRGAFRLRGCTLPTGRRYDGQFHLSGDIEDAARFCLDLDLPEQSEKFYGEGQLEVF